LLQVLATLLLIPSKYGIDQILDLIRKSAFPIPDQSWLLGSSTVAASNGVVSFQDLAIARANGYPPDYPNPTAGPVGTYYVQFSTSNLIAVAGISDSNASSIPSILGPFQPCFRPTNIA
jgi:hypothetical protein